MIGHCEARDFLGQVEDDLGMAALLCLSLARFCLFPTSFAVRKASRSG